MTPYDVTMLVVVLAAMVWGGFKGLTWQLATLGSLLAGYLVAWPLSAELAPRFPGEGWIARGLALALTYVAISGGIFLVAWLVRRGLKQAQMEAYDRHLGMVLGAVVGVCVVVVGTLAAVSLTPTWREPIFQSNSGRVVGHILAGVESTLPGDLHTRLDHLWIRPEVMDSSADRSGETTASRWAEETEQALDAVGERLGERADELARGFGGPSNGARRVDPARDRDSGQDSGLADGVAETAEEAWNRFFSEFGSEVGRSLSDRIGLDPSPDEDGS